LLRPPCSGWLFLACSRCVTTLDKY
jgi:hypothetical protein